jgi:NAD(P)-dependent dehydrogenase (short-subunit alcohol dehydrogenase family)
MKEFAGKVAVVTGGASGIGRAIAEWCVRADVKVVLADVEEDALRRAGEELEAMGGTVLAVKTDVAKRAEVEALADRAFERFGAVHLLFNNAGVAAGGAPWEASWNDWEWVIGVNLWGVIHGVKVFTPRMLAQNAECHIVNTASGAGLIAGGFSAPYSATKHAVVALSESLYFGLQQRNALVKVSVLCPGIVRTNIAFCQRNRPPELQDEPVAPSAEMAEGRARFDAVMAGAMPASEVADQVFEAIRKEQFYVLSDAKWMDLVRLRVDKLVRLENPENPGPLAAEIVRA